MIRLLIATLLGVVLVSGCQPLTQSLSETAAETTAPAPIIIHSPTSLTSKWLQILEKQLQLSPEQASEGIRTSEPPINDTERFEQLLLRQQLQQRGGWIVARDRLRELRKRYQSHEVDPLLAILLAHNQAQINREQRERRLNQQLTDLLTAYETVIRLHDESIAETELLKAKIEALTNLERQLNIRRTKEAANTELPSPPASTPTASQAPTETEQTIKNPNDE